MVADCATEAASRVLDDGTVVSFDSETLIWRVAVHRGTDQRLAQKSHELCRVVITVPVRDVHDAVQERHPQAETNKNTFTIDGQFQTLDAAQ